MIRFSKYLNALIVLLVHKFIIVGRKVESCFTFCHLSLSHLCVLEADDWAFDCVGVTATVSTWPLLVKRTSALLLEGRSRHDHIHVDIVRATAGTGSNNLKLELDALGMPLDLMHTVC